MDTQKIEQVINLMAETGLFFAKADGQYNVQEKNFIENFLAKLGNFGDVNEVRDNIEAYLTKSLSLDQVVADTKALVSGFNDVEKAGILASLAGFIESVINSANAAAAPEQANFEAWKKALL